MKISLIIPTRNRPLKVKRLLKYIKAQNLRPDELILVENITEQKYFCKKYLEEFFDKKINIKYFAVKNKTIGFSRNVGLLKASHDVLVYVDDDVHLVDKYLLTKIKRRFKHFKEIACLVGPVLASKNSYWAKAGEYLYNGDNLLYDKRKLEYASSSFVVFNKKILTKKNILFDNKLNTKEDINFTLSLAATNEKILFDSKLFVHHDFVNSLLTFCKKHINYSKNNLKSYLEYGPKSNLISVFLLYKKTHLLLLPVYLFKRNLAISLEQVRELEIERKFLIAFFIRNSFYLFNLYSSLDGLKLVWAKYKLFSSKNRGSNLVNF